VRRILFDGTNGTNPWIEKGCSVFSQYFDLVYWLGEQLSELLGDEGVGVSADAPRSGVFPRGVFTCAQREDLKKAVGRGDMRLLLGTDAALAILSRPQWAVSGEEVRQQRVYSLVWRSMTLRIPGVMSQTRIRRADDGLLARLRPCRNRHESHRPGPVGARHDTLGWLWPCVSVADPQRPG
jgi:hypothetical protein